MYKKNEKWVYFIIGLGSGIVVSGMIMTILSLVYVAELRAVENRYVVEIQNQKQKHEETIIPIQEDEVAKKIIEEGGYKRVDIPIHYGSIQIASLLEEEGIVDDGEAFNAFLVEQNKTKSLRTGVKYFPLGSDYEEILQILLGKKQ